MDKCDVFIFKKSGMTDKHFLEETKDEWLSPYLLKGIELYDPTAKSRKRKSKEPSVA